jgi:multicomponent Na+:H+ antiporter subunit F
MSDWFILGIRGVLALLMVSILLSTIRLGRGPSLADRVIALDLIVAASVTLLAILSISFQKVVFLDVAIVLALVSFVATVAFAVFLQKRAKEEEK